MAWAQSRCIHHILIQPGRPMQHGYIESFNGKFCDQNHARCTSKGRVKVFSTAYRP